MNRVSTNVGKDESDALMAKKIWAVYHIYGGNLRPFFDALGCEDAGVPVKNSRRDLFAEDQRFSTDLVGMRPLIHRGKAKAKPIPARS